MGGKEKGTSIFWGGGPKTNSSSDVQKVETKVAHKAVKMMGGIRKLRNIVVTSEVCTLCIA